MGREIIQNINAYTKTKCGYATVHDVIDMSLEDRMESFFLSETCKYLYLVISRPILAAYIIHHLHAVTR